MSYSSKVEATIRAPSIPMDPINTLIYLSIFFVKRVMMSKFLRDVHALVQLLVVSKSVEFDFFITYDPCKGIDYHMVLKKEDKFTNILIILFLLLN